MEDERETEFDPVIHLLHLVAAVLRGNDNYKWFPPDLADDLAAGYDRLAKVPRIAERLRTEVYLFPQYWDWETESYAP